MKARSSLLCCVLLAGCTVGPDYQPDPMALPTHFQDGPAADPAAIARTNAEMRDWWALLHDATLDALVRAAIAGNYDLQAADAHIAVERDLRSEAISAYYPQVDALAGAGDIRISNNIDNWPLRPGNPANRPDASLLTYGATASWEFDVFGRIHRAVEAQGHAVEVSVEERRGVLLAILSDLVANYVDLRATQARLVLAQHNLADAEEALSLAERLYAHGVGNNLQVSQARTERDAQAARLDPLQARIMRAIHAIGILAGQPPASLETALRGPASLPVMPPLPATLPSIVVANRPDIRAAERRYAEDTARIGVAVADLYPRFTAPLSFTPQASAAYQLFETGALAWRFVMMASLPVVQGGRITAQIAQARAQAQDSRLHYRSVVLHGFGEVENAFSDWQHDVQATKRLEEAAADAERTHARALKLYRAGLTDFLNVLSAERSVLAQQDGVEMGREAQLRDAVRLYVAMGAGWQGALLNSSALPVEQPQQNAWARGVAARAFAR